MNVTVKAGASAYELVIAVFAAIKDANDMSLARQFRDQVKGLDTFAEVEDIATTNFGAVITQDLDEVKELAYSQIDEAANRLDARYTTVGGQMPAVYKGKIDHCDRWEADGSPVDVSSGSYGYIRAEMKRLAILGQPASAADAVAAMRGVAVAWEDTIGELREEHRGVGKANVEVATTVEEIETALNAALAALNAI